MVGSGKQMIFYEMTDFQLAKNLRSTLRLDNHEPLFIYSPIYLFVKNKLCKYQKKKAFDINV